MRILESLIPSCLLHHGMASSASDDFEILHCNNEVSLEPEMKIQVSKNFYENHGDLSDPDSWAIGFVETEAGFEKAFPSSDLELDFDDDNNPDCKFLLSCNIGPVLYGPKFRLQILRTI